MPKASTQPLPTSEIEPHPPYELRISRLTVDKLGVKLYDKVSAVVAELVANGYDADAERIWIELPLSTVLARRNGSAEETEEEGWVITVKDDGHGMTPQEAIACFLRVGRDRRMSPGGALSRKKKRPVMGRKGIGKLAPFGICQKMEIISSGGKKTPAGYLTSHFFLDYHDLMKDEETSVPLVAGERDGTYEDNRGTVISLSNFLPKKVPDADTFHRQLASRFVFAQPDFKIIVQDTRDPETNPPRKVEPVDVAIVPNTKIDVSTRPVTVDDEELPVTGWLAMAKEAYKNEEFSGVRIYARNKIVATTRDFEQAAGFTGEFTIRSYLVGEVYAEWLDLDDGEDLIRSDRQSILWDSDYGRALREWGSSLIKEIGSLAKDPRRKRVRQMFLDKSDVEAKAKKKYGDDEVAAAAINIAKQIGAFADEGELQDEDYIDGLTEFILSVAPHKALIEAFQKFSAEAAGGDEPTLASLIDLFGKTRVAEVASYGQIAAERVRAIRELEPLVLSNAKEDELQQLLARAPWLIEPNWTVISKNQALKTFKTLFEDYYTEHNDGATVSLAVTMEDKRPDFTLVSLGHKLYIVEIKRPKYKFNDSDAERLVNYIEVFDEFFEKHKEVQADFPQGYQIILIVDDLDMKRPNNKQAIKAALKDEKLRHTNWKDFLLRTKNAHNQFLEANDLAKKKGKK